MLGRNKAGTLRLSKDSHGLWGEIIINERDGDAVNLFERVKRGDVDQCSFFHPVLLLFQIQSAGFFSDSPSACPPLVLYNNFVDTRIMGIGQVISQTLTRDLLYTIGDGLTTK